MVKFKMAERKEGESLLSGQATSPSSEVPLFHEKGKSPKDYETRNCHFDKAFKAIPINWGKKNYGTQLQPQKLWMYIFMTFVVVMMMITLIICLFRGSVDPTYLLLGVSIISIGFVQGILIYWSRTGELPAEKLWFLYFVGICLVLESIFTDVLLYHRPTASS